MKKSFSIIPAIGFIVLSGFSNESVNHEQIAFDYFVSDIMKADFKDVTSLQFTEKTEGSFSSLGKINFCLKPERLGTIVGKATGEETRIVKEIKFGHVRDVKISEPGNKTSAHRLRLYPSLHVADNYYVFLSFSNQTVRPGQYVFELNPEGRILRSCKMQ